jgi:hypothetical protein
MMAQKIFYFPPNFFHAIALIANGCWWEPELKQNYYFLKITIWFK